MVEIDALIDDILSPLRQEGISVNFMYKIDRAKMPAVTYYIVADRDDFRTDNEADSQLSRIQIDTWTESRSEMSSVAIKAAELMSESGWIREAMRDMPREADNQAWHRTMRFAKEVFADEHGTN